MSILVAHKLHDDGLTVSTNHDYISLINVCKTWFEKNGIIEPDNLRDFSVRFHSKSDAMVFMLKFAGKPSATRIITLSPDEVITRGYEASFKSVWNNFTKSGQALIFQPTQGDAQIAQSPTDHQEDLTLRVGLSD